MEGGLPTHPADILTGETVRASARVEVVKAAGDVAVPDVFLGRGHKVAELLGLLDPAGAGPQAMLVAAVAGMGKTALARHAAADAVNKGWFPGGAFFIDMHGYGTQARVGPGQVYAPLLTFLRPGEQIPAAPKEQAAVYRQLLAERAERNKPMLLVLDNVSHPDQVAGLLPAHRAHRVVMTSRGILRLGNLRVLDLGVLDPSDAVRILDEVLHRRNEADQRVALQPGPAKELATLCGCLPLALRIAAELLAYSPGRPIANMIADLADVRTRIDHFNEGERSVAAAFELSWEHLLSYDEDAAELFPLLSVNPGPEISPEAAAALADWKPSRASAPLGTLHRFHLIEASATAPGRWRTHDLVGLYAARLAETLSADARTDAFDRLFQHYQAHATGCARRAGWLLLRHSRPLDKPDPEPRPGWPERSMALVWFTAEEANLLGCVRRVAELDPEVVDHDRGAALVALIDAMAGYLRNNGPWGTAVEVHRLAADVAERLGDTRARGIAFNDLGITYRLLGAPQALEVLEQAKRLFGGLGVLRRPGDTRAALLGQANALNEMGIVYNKRGDYDDAVEVLDEARLLYREVADEIGMANASKNIGVTIYNIGLREKDPATRDAAQEPLQEALSRYEGIDDYLGVAEVRNQLGLLWLKSDRPEMARGEFDKALKLAEEAGSLLEKARACEGIGDCQVADAIISLETAGAIYRDIGADNDLANIMKRLDWLRGRPIPDGR
jgi:tetratricopeptide (TPR) repeat protein